jgi:2-polyprenyl-6-methoxyphenol hydroxylase-like FAD-dependent oxidoreductase
MTLATVPRYDHERISPAGDHAVVVGASMAGLLAARVLADGFEEVTVIERDALADEPGVRRGVPQGRHVHLLEEAGRATLEDLFPGYGEELLSAGGLMIDMLSDFVAYQKGGVLAPGPTRIPAYFATRPLFERIVHRRVAGLDGVSIRHGCQYVDYLADDATTVDGITIENEASEREDLPAELVVDATGRMSRTPAWLENYGYGAPDVDEVRIDVAYSTAAIERPADDRRAFFIEPDPPRTRGAGVFPAEDGRWLATFFGVHGDHPPTEPEGLKAFAASLPGPDPKGLPDLEGLLDTQPWESDEMAHYPFPSTRRHRYEDLDRFPDGLVVIGDAIASFNPIYGQGMSVAALEALALHHTLATGGRADLGRRFFDRTEEILDVPWSIAVGGDFEFPQTEGPKPRGTDFFNWYLARLMRKAHTNGKLSEALVRVIMMEKPPTSLFRPGIVWQVLKPTVRGSSEASVGPKPSQPSTRR